MASGGRAPAEPNYVQAASEQGRQNILAAQENARLNRVGTNNAYGSTSWTGNDRDGYTLNTTLAPEQQQLLAGQNQNALTGNRLAGQALGQYGATAGQGINTSGYNPRTTNVATPNFQRNVTSPGVAQGSINTSGLSTLPTAGDYSADRQKYEDTYYNSQMKTLDPQFQQQESAMRSRLLNSGVTEGSEGWKRAWDDFSRGRTAAYGDARDRAILGAGQEQSRMFGDALAGRQQGFGERTTEGNFANDAAAQQLQSELAKLGFFNETGQQDFENSFANAQLGNEQRDAQFGEDAANRSMTMQELMQLIGMGGGPTGTPGTANAAGGQGIEPVDTMGAIQNQYAGQMNRYNNRVASANSQNQATAAAIGSALAYFSDRRLKTDITRIGTLGNGLPTYSFRYLWDERPRVGVMSDDVRRYMPEAVHVHESGYDMVNYAAIGAAHLVEAA